MSNSIDLTFLVLAYKQAKKGYGKVASNPLVGAVLVKDNKLIEVGYHESFGGDHAEVNLLKKVNKTVSNGATLYVTLIPCCHTGKTPPCTDAIIKAGISRVVYASDDPNPLIAGKSVQILESAGVQVEKIFVKKIDHLNRRFFYNISTGKPYITLKVAMTIDGMVALENNRNSKNNITNDLARSDLHKIRAGHEAILVGSNTLLFDNPNLGVHGTEFGTDPFRFLFTTKELDVFDASFEFFRDSRYCLVSSYDELIKECRNRSISSVLVEGGPTVLSYFMKNGYYNELIVYYANFALGSDNLPALKSIGINSLATVKKLKLVDIKRFAGNYRVKYINI